MGFRFRKSIRIMPGVRVNLSKTGISTSVGGRGATVNVSKRGVRGTVGIPGTGLSYSERLSGPARGGRQDAGVSPGRSGGGRAWLWIVAIVVVAIIVF